MSLQNEGGRGNAIVLLSNTESCLVFFTINFCCCVGKLEGASTSFKREISVGRRNDHARIQGQLIRIGML